MYSRYYLTDLHVHTPADANHRYGTGLPRDPDESFAKELVQAHADAGVKVFAVADHNSVDWWPVLFAAGRRVGITVFPGVEISVNRCHLLAIFEADKTGHAMAQRFLADRFDPGEPLFARGAPRPVSRGSIRDVAESVAEHDGLLLAPHSTTKGIGIFAPGVCTNSAELAQGELFAAFDVMGDKGADVLGNPRSKFGTTRPRWFLSGDTRSLDDVGKRAVYLKLGAKPTLEGLRQAFLATATRVRFPDRLHSDWGRVKGIEFASGPEPYWPRLSALRIQGGFHSGLDVAFAPGLNAVIGGKGTGKSALIEALRHIVGARQPEDQALQENRRHNFPANADGAVEFVDVRGERYEVRRSGGSRAPELYRDGAPSEVSVERRLQLQIFGQRELRELLQPATLREFVARHAGADWEKLLEDERALVRDLERTGTELSAEELELSAIDEFAAERADLVERIDRARKSGADRALVDGAALTRSDAMVRRALAWPAEVEHELATLASLLPPPDITAVPTAPEGVKELLTTLAHRLEQAIESVEQTASMSRDQVAALASEWQGTVLAARSEVERRLAEAGITNAEELAAWQSRLAELDEILEAGPARKARLGALDVERQGQIARLNALRRRKSRQIEQAGRELQSVLPPRVRLRIAPLGDRRAFATALEAAVRGQGVRHDQLRILSEQEPQSVAAAMAAGPDAMLALGVTASTAAKLAAIAATVRRSLEVADVPDLVELDLDLSVTGSGEWRSVEEVSPGQRATALLALVLAVGNEPLIIDQPEDDLDNRYIYDEVVKTLARVCEQRQVLVATHNANVPILGDAELILALDADASHSSVIACGGLEDPRVAAHARQILEGGDAAFQARRRRYLAASA